MEKKRRDNLRRIIRECRSIVESEIVRRLRYYGLESDGFIDPKSLSYLTAADLEVRSKLEQAIEKEMVGGLGVQQAVTRYVSHVGFTYIDRLAALRAMEVRGFIKESVILRDKYGGMSLREMELIEKEPSLTPNEAAKRALIDAFREVGQEIKVLFDVEDEYSIIFPETKSIKELIRLLSEKITEEDWKEDDIIGWIYQYYNDEARQKFREAKGRPTPDDIPVVSQFYTPDWIVKVLVDNTLGQMWLDMQPTSKLAELCKYLVVRKDESNSKRERKSVREIKVLDPACGSGHFLLYAFDVLFQMYKEDELSLPDSEIPSLILENNLYGIDIDLRAVQLAALSLYLKAKTFNPKMKIQRMNLVSADIRILDGERKKEFLGRFSDDPPLKQIFERLFEDLGYTYEIGSLLKIRAPFEQLFRDRRSGYAKAEYDLVGQTQLSEGGIIGQSKFVMSDSDIDQPSLGWAIPKERTIEEMLEALTKFESEAFQGKDMGTLLFSSEVVKSIGLLELLSKQYDIVLMNPPHGIMPLKIVEYAKRYYPRTYYDYYGAFIEQGIDMCLPNGFIGVLAGRALLFTKSFQNLREKNLQFEAFPEVVLDLGFKTMEEAHARHIALVLRHRGNHLLHPNGHTITFFNLTTSEWDNKRMAFESALKGVATPILYTVTLRDLAEIPGTTYAYWAPPILRSLFRKFPPLDRDVAGRPDQPKIADVKVGLQTGDDSRFTRFWWEVPTILIAASREETFHGKKWVPFANEFYLFYFYADLPVVVNWENDGKTIGQFSGSVSRSKNFYFLPGLSWSANWQMTQLRKLWEIKRLPFRAHPSGAIFGVGAQAVIADSKMVWPLLAICSSQLVFAISRLIASENKQGTAVTASLPIALPKPSNGELDRLGALAQEAHDILQEWATGDEISTPFIKPWILQVHGFDSMEKSTTGHPLAVGFEWSKWPVAVKIRSICANKTSSLKELVELCDKQKGLLEQRIDEIQRQIDEEVYRIYGISDEDRRMIERELVLQRGLELSDTGEGQPMQDEERTTIITEEAKDHIKRLISFYVKKIMESDEVGIVPLDQSFENNLPKRIRVFIALDFGKERADDIEKEMEEILGCSIQDWLANEFFDFHLTLYRKRPIFWQLTSKNFGTVRGSVAFSCFIHYHKLSRDTIPKIQALYLRTVMEKVKVAKEQVSEQLMEAQNNRDKERIEKLRKDYQRIGEKLAELEKFDAALTEVHNPRKDKGGPLGTPKWTDWAIAEVRDNGWNPIIDYGVRVNIEPLKEAGVLPPSASRVK